MWQGHRHWIRVVTPSLVQGLRRRNGCTCDGRVIALLRGKKVLIGGQDTEPYCCRWLVCQPGTVLSSDGAQHDRGLKR